MCFILFPFLFPQLLLFRLHGGTGHHPGREVCLQEQELLRLVGHVGLGPPAHGIQGIKDEKAPDFLEDYKREGPVDPFSLIYSISMNIPAPKSYSISGRGLTFRIIDFFLYS